MLSSASAALGGTRQYVVNPGSSITSVCNACGTPPAAPAPLRGSFEVTVLPVGAVFDVAALTQINLTGADITVKGNGFLQRLGRDRQAMVIDALVNDARVLFTSGRRQPAETEDIRMVLSSPRTERVTYVLVLSASPAEDQPPDVDGDQVPDGRDNCPADANTDQSDVDGDRVGDACDRCPQTAAGSLTTGEGCSVEQLCPCDAARSGELWDGQREYLRCVVRATRALRREGQMSQAQRLGIIRRASRSGCGRTIVALN